VTWRDILPHPHCRFKTMDILVNNAGIASLGS
jgi:NADP-dependent 3-hydroxy acid dehydrogenase YdfG